MNFDRENRVQVEPVINLKDCAFFGGLGFVISILTAITDQIDLPVNMERDFLSSLFFDHIPFNSIVVLLISMIVMVCLSVAMSRKKESYEEALIHISNRVSQLCSPAFFIVIGQIPVLLLLGLFTEHKAYYAYTITFFVFAFMLFMMSGISNVITSQFDLAHRKLSPKLAFPGVIAIILATITQFALDRRPIIVEVPFTVSDYEILETLADEKDIEVEVLIKQLASEGYKNSKSFKNDS
ncbi:hypothetical protein [Vibrio lentus]|uniref:hypothetical protein n=1 Tax=Vibrio lentus TaxID=136468 RepID=UPI000C863420|nr:hypothetical protein [Vibrio lentus]PMJ59442.1 hypothetical protein BCU18_10220 [Vibrio lentus]PMM60256.1 hypothetical protein BCT51_03780 [Vibrio lentus]